MVPPAGAILAVPDFRVIKKCVTRWCVSTVNRTASLIIFLIFARKFDQTVKFIGALALSITVSSRASSWKYYNKNSCLKSSVALERCD